MLPSLASGICLLFIAYLFWTDSKRLDSRSIALWIPLVWMFLAGSRWASSWFDMAPRLQSAADYADGSPIDAAVFSTLLLAGIAVLLKRKIDWGRLLTQNWVIVLYLLYCLASIVWTNDPYVLAKRWIKDLGNPVMVLVILTERRPYEAIGIVLRRLAFLLLPLSVLFIKYYPELSRVYRPDGSPMYTGVGHQKNDLGLMCLVAGIYLFWDFLWQYRKTKRSFVSDNRIVALALISMVAWLLYLSNSQTSLVCIIVVFFILLVGRTFLMALGPTGFLGSILCAVVLIGLLDQMLGLKGLALSLIGRDPTLTNRTDIWSQLIELGDNPIVGAGFMSFWTGARLEMIWRLVGSEINQAHNGYLEQYLNLGYIGVGFVVAIMLSGLLKVKRHLSVDPGGGMLRLCFIIAAVLYNYTEASFYGINNMWILLLIGCVEVAPSSQQQSVRVGRNSGLRKPTLRRIDATSPL